MPLSKLRLACCQSVILVEDLLRDDHTLGAVLSRAEGSAGKRFVLDRTSMLAKLELCLWEAEIGTSL